MKDNNFIRSALFFDSMIMPKIIAFVYWVMLAGVVISGIMAIANGSFLKSLLILIVGSVGVRLWCELMIVLFKINANLQKIADKS